VEDYQTLVLVSAAAIVAIVVVSIIWTTVRRRRRARALHAPIPLIPFSNSPGLIERPPRPVPDSGSGTITPQREEVAMRQPTADAWAPPRAPVTPTGFDRPSAPVAAGSERTAHGADRMSDQALVETALVDDAVSGAPVEGASMRYWRPADGTLQFLPGRLEVVAGRDAGQEIRFVRTPGPDGTRVTFGRAEGPPYRHVQLREPTVSRVHARMTLESGAAAAAEAGVAVSPGGGGGVRWRLENLSATNPVVVNGRPLGADGGPSGLVVLLEGDRIEMGEVVFRFHEK